MKLLDTIHSPDDLKKLDIPKLAGLSREIREFIIAHIARNGGHLAPSLGVVELTLALHYLFDSPRDKIVWDVGHQAYVHKIITGRKDSFPTIRQFKGISGFPKMSESPHDCFGVGHASTSISAAIGMACARDLSHEDYHVLAVIGDGSLTGGLAFEGLNNAGSLGKDLVVVLNDNEMSISKNVGALSNYLTTLITMQSYNKLKKEVWELTGKMSGLGQRIRRIVGRLDESLKAVVMPGLLFERLGFRYIGPIDGHNLARLIRVFRLVKTLKGPILVHVVTRKGKGYSPAEKNASQFHGLGAFNQETGESIKIATTPGYTAVFGSTVMELAQHDRRIVAITAAMALGTGLHQFAEAHPDRFFDVGIAEGHAVTFAAGLATRGYRPVVALYSSFLQRGYDQIIHDVALQKLPVIFAIDRAGIVGADGPTHHGVFDLSYLRAIPDLIIMSPRDEEELRNMLFTAWKYEHGPVAIRYPRGAGIGLSLEKPMVELPIGKSEVFRFGHDLAILAVGPMVYTALEVRDLLKADDISAQIINARFIKPLDEARLQETFESFPLVVTLEDNTRVGGFGGAVAEVLAERFGEQTRLIRLGIPDAFVEHGATQQLFQSISLDARSVYETVLKHWSDIHSRYRLPKGHSKKTN